MDYVFVVRDATGEITGASGSVPPPGVEVISQVEISDDPVNGLGSVPPHAAGGESASKSLEMGRLSSPERVCQLMAAAAAVAVRQYWETLVLGGRN
ncbi:MAG: hypothetical protein V1846_00205 [Candidatus Komeilibacteria bacterium]